jgi:hypothetical protein
MSLDVAQFGDGSINFLYEGRTAIGQRRTQSLTSSTSDVIK